MSPGWQSSVLQIASSVEKRTARAFPVLRIDRLARVISTASDNSGSDMRRRSNISSSLTAMGMIYTVPSNSSHGRTCREHTTEHKNHEDSDPAPGREGNVGRSGAQAREE